MGREIVYCWKCASRLKGEDFDNQQAFRIGDKVSCPDCVDELVADLPAEEQEAILSPPKRSATQASKKISSTKIKAQQPDPSKRTGPATTVRPGGRSTGVYPKVKTGTTGPVPTAGGTRMTKKVTRPIPKVQPPEDDEGAEDGAGEKPPMDEKKKKLILIGGIGGGLLLLIIVLGILVLLKKPEPVKHKTAEETEATTKPVKPAVVESPKEKAVKALLKEESELPQDALGQKLKKLREAQKEAQGTSMADGIEAMIDGLKAKIDKAIAAVGKEVDQAYAAGDFKTVLEAYDKAKTLHDVPEWQDGIATKVKLIHGRIDDEFRRAKTKAKDEREAGNEDKVKEIREQVAKWGQPDLTEKFDQFLATLAAADPDPGKNPANPDSPPQPSVKANLKPLSPAMKSFMPSWQKALGAAFNRDYASAATEMSGLVRQADGDEPKKAAADDAETLKTLGDLYGETLKAAAQAPKLAALTLEYQHQPGEWRKVTGKALKVEPTRFEFKPDTPKDGKDQPAILIEFTDLNAGSLALLYKGNKKLDKKTADRLAIFCLIEGAPEAAQATGGSAPDRFWHHAATARENAPKPERREFEARILFHQSEFEWRKSATKLQSIEHSKTLMNDYTSTAVVKRYQPVIAKRAETGKEYVFLPGDLGATGDYNTYKLIKKDDVMWITTKGIDFRDSLFNYIEAEFIALPGVTYRCWVYAGGCCQEVWNGSYQSTEGTTLNKGKQVPIDPGVQMAAPLPMPAGLKKTHDEHKPKGAKEHPKTPAKWDWISIPLPKTYSQPGAKSIRILTDQQGFAVKYVIISSTRKDAPNDKTAAELKELALAGGSTPAKSEVKGTPQPKEWLIIGPFPEGLPAEEGPEKDVDLSKELKGKTGNVKWKPGAGVMTGTSVKLDWEKGVFNPKDNVSAYALIHVKAHAAMDCRLLLSHDDGGRAWVNGKLVHDNNRPGGMKPDEFNVAIHLEEGWNRLLFKVSTGTGGFGLMMRIADGAKKPIDSLEYSPYGDSLESP